MKSLLNCRLRTSPMLSFLGALACACGGDAATGDLQVVLQAETTIVDGLEPGDTREQVRDGWSVRFDTYIVVVGDIELALAADPHQHRTAASVHAVDLTKVPAAGLPVWTLEGLRAGRWSFGYRLASGSKDTVKHDTVSKSDFESVKREGWSYLIEGKIKKKDGVSCPPTKLAQPPSKLSTASVSPHGEQCYPASEVRFRFGVESEIALSTCEVDGVPGISVPAGGQQSVAITIHGDHIFFNGFPTGTEGGVKRLAQWLADSDLNLDGEVTREELQMLRPSDLAELDSRYQFGEVMLMDMWDYVAAQLRTQGHFQGEGECAASGAKPHTHGA